MLRRGAFLAVLVISVSGTAIVNSYSQSGFEEFKIEQKYYEISYSGNTLVKLYGTLGEDSARGNKLSFTITNPNGDREEVSVIPSKHGYFENYLVFDRHSVLGDYIVRAYSYDGNLIGKVRYGKSTIQYSIIKTSRRKTSQIVVDRDHVVVRTPKSKTAKQIQNLMKEKAQWIYKKKLEYRKIKPSIEKPKYTEGSFLPYLGKNYILRIKKTRKKDFVKLSNAEIIINTSKKLSKKSIQQIYEQWLMKQAEKIIPNRLEKLSKKIGVKPSSNSIKILKDRWGSRTVKGKINLNVNLLKAPKDVIDYIIIHELCHLKINNHSFRYWNLVRKFMPNYKIRVDWLNQNHEKIS